MKYPEELLAERVKELEAVLRWISDCPYADPITRDRKVRAALAGKVEQ